MIRRNIANRITGRLIMWMLVLLLVLSGVFYYWEVRNIIRLHAELYHNKMLIGYEYTRRILSDVYVSVTNNVSYLEQSLDHPESHMDVMKQIVSQGNRVHSCGINYIDNYYPQKSNQFHPLAWRNADNPDEILTKEKDDDDSNYLNATWFRSAIESDSARWTEPFFDNDDRNTALTAYIVPIHNAAGKPVAVLHASISLDWLTNKLSKTDIKYNDPNSSIPNIFELKSKRFIIDYAGRFLTYPGGVQNMEGTFFTHLKPRGNYDIELLIERMETGKTSMNESDVKYIFDNEECYLFFTPVKHTDWMMVTVVPCQSVNTAGLVYCLQIMSQVFLIMLVLILINYFYLRRETNLSSRARSF
ncbi:MAG: hypothetical protein J6W43_07370 [Prevotella sp.]|nr:hypothetical protein [Prevotella sp.]